MRFRILFIGIAFQLVTCSVSGQENRQLGYMPWHRLDSLRLGMLGIGKADDSSKTCSLHCLIKISGDAFIKHYPHLSKDFLNQCVKNYMFDDSWIDTAYGITSQIRFMQAEFDLAELYARQLRKVLYENGHATKKFIRTTEKTLQATCKNEFARLERETASGKNIKELEKWQSYISTNLKSLAEYESSERVILN
jgi:hypothetical protein